MAKNLDSQLEEIKNDIKEMSKYMAKQIAIQASNDFYDAREQIVNSFYSSYSRKSHTTRKKLLRDAMVIEDTVGLDTRYVVGLSLNGSAMDPNVEPGDSITGDNILDLIINQGVRGLPENGTEPLSHSYDLFGHHYEEGEPWHNYYWNPESYGNIFKTKIHIGNFTSSLGTPNQVLHQLVNNWGEHRGIDCADKVAFKAKQKFNKNYR